MHTVHRVIAATAIALPLALAGSGMALAHDAAKKETLAQVILQHLHQSNTTGPIAASGDATVDVTQANLGTQSTTNSVKEAEKKDN